MPANVSQHSFLGVSSASPVFRVSVKLLLLSALAILGRSEYSIDCKRINRDVRITREAGEPVKTVHCLKHISKTLFKFLLFGQVAGLKFGHRIKIIATVFGGLGGDDPKHRQFDCGSIRWRADTDKEGKESVVPLSPQARAAVDRHVAQMRGLGLRGIGDAPLFPSPRDPSTPMIRAVADRWLREAETLAELEPHDGSLWHVYRRRWATVRKHLPATDVAEAGGWAGPETLQKCYQQPDEETMYEVVTGGGALREAAQ